MPTIELPGGTREFCCTAGTATIYEHEFYDDPNPKVTGDLIADVFGKHEVDPEKAAFAVDEETGEINSIVIDFTYNNWMAERRALWAMMRTQEVLDTMDGKKPHRVAPYEDWDRALFAWEPDLREVSKLVTDELYRGLF